MVFDTGTKCLESVKMFWQWEPSILATAITDSIYSSQGELCKKRVIDKFNVAVEWELVKFLLALCYEKEMKNIRCSS
jgi:hypothetical protein